MPSHDLFFARGLPGLYLATDRFVLAAQQSGFTGVEYVDAGTYSFDDFPE
jgi:hypothetical protein